MGKIYFFFAAILFLYNILIRNKEIDKDQKKNNSNIHVIQKINNIANDQITINRNNHIDKVYLFVSVLCRYKINKYKEIIKLTKKARANNVCNLLVSFSVSNAGTTTVSIRNTKDHRRNLSACLFLKDSMT